MTGRKKPKTLSGIETRAFFTACWSINCRKKPKTLSGIETCRGALNHSLRVLGRKKPKTLSGIETSP